MRNKSKIINDEIIVQAYQHKDVKTLYVYTLLTCATAEYGYIGYHDCLKTLSKFTKLSQRTIRRWLDEISQTSLVTIKSGNVHPIGREKFEKRFKLTVSSIEFKEQHLRSYRAFREHAIQQCALLVQKRFRRAYSSLSKENPDSLVKSGKIENKLAALQNKEQAGCSISQLEKRLRLDKKTISEALKGHTIKQVNFSEWINGTIARAKYGVLIDQMVGNIGYHLNGQPLRPIPNNIHKMCFEYDRSKDMYRIGHAIGSIIKVDPFLKYNRNINIK